MAKRRKGTTLLTDSPFFNKEELGTKSKLVPLSYNKDDDVYITKRVIYKGEEFVKLIVNKRINVTKYFELSNLAKNLLYYITTTCLEYNSVVFNLKIEKFSEVVKVSNKSNSIYKAINELIDAKYIARTDSKELYWINHNYYYKGNFITIKKVENL